MIGSITFRIPDHDEQRPLASVNQKMKNRRPRDFREAGKE